MSYTKIISAGDLVEVYTYEREPSPKRLRKSALERRETFYKPRRQRRADNLNKAKQSFRRLIRANLQKGNPALLTLTMLDILPYADAVRCFTSFGQKARREFGQSFAWVAVAEFQRRGALHFHALVWGLTPYDVESEKRTRRIQNIWGFGYVDIAETDGSPKLSTYLSKYMQKSMQDVRLLGKRAYCASRNLLRPLSFNTPTSIDLFTEAVGLADLTPLQDRAYDTQWLGRANYKSYSTYQNGNEPNKIAG